MTLLLASSLLPAARQLAVAAHARGWSTHFLDKEPHPHVTGNRTFYGGTDKADFYARQFELCLIEPPLDLITRVPPDLLARTVSFGMLEQLRHARGPLFIKPADPINKSFDAGVHATPRAIRARTPIPADTPILVSTPVEWTSEFRCFVREGEVEAWSPYLSFGRPVWKPGSAGPLPTNLRSVCDRLFSRMSNQLPPAFVVDVGVLDDGRWAVVEFNPAWCSGLLGANVDHALHVIERSAMFSRTATAEDVTWTRHRSPLPKGA
jgi:hypothetical protein